MSLLVQIAAEFVGKKQFKEADKAVKGLQSSVKKLAGAAGIGLSTAAIVNFGKKSVAAFIADEKAASQLAQSVKNLGLAFETPRIEKFISEMSMASGVADDVLRPSMQKLLQTTGSVAKSQELLTQALDISRGSGVDFETVVGDLTAAYVGQTRGLRKYSLGLSVAELKTMSFAEVQERLNKQFSGSNAAYLETYAGKLEVITTAAGEAQETIGKGLIDAFIILSSESGNIKDLTTAMTTFAEGTAAAFRNVAVLVSNLDKAMQAGFGLVGVLDRITGSNFVKMFGGVAGLLGTMGGGSFGSGPIGGMGGYPSSALGPGYIDPNVEARRKAEAARIKREKELAALQKKNLDAQRKQNALTKAAKTLDIERINITAALRGKISETDRLSLNLQLALLDKNDQQATKLSTELENATKRQQILNAALLATPEAPNPYRNWIPPSLQNMYDSQQYFGPQGGLGAGVVAGVTPQVNVVVNLDGNAVTNAITETQVNQSLSGTFSDINRVAARGSVGIR